MTEELWGAGLKVLDHGFVKLVETWGSDERVIESARQSTQGGFVSWDAYEGHPKGDAGLLAYLWKNNHATPFEMAGFTVEVQAPIFVFREWHRHRTQSYSEMSARYAPLPDLNYVPTLERVMLNAGGTNKQAGTVDGARELDMVSAKAWIRKLEARYELAQADYEQALEAGVPKELARILLPVGRYSRMRASANLRNWLGFLKLRLDPKAQYEIRAFAAAVEQIVIHEFPRTWKLFAASSEA